MVIKDREGNPLEKDHLYRELWINEDYSRSFKYARVSDFSEDSDNFFLNLEYENGTQNAYNGFHVYNISNKLTPLTETEAQELIQDRKQKLNFLERHSQSSPKFIGEDFECLLKVPEIYEYI